MAAKASCRKGGRAGAHRLPRPLVQRAALVIPMSDGTFGTCSNLPAPGQNYGPVPAQTLGVPKDGDEECHMHGRRAQGEEIPEHRCK